MDVDYKKHHELTKLPPWRVLHFQENSTWDPSTRRDFEKI